MDMDNVEADSATRLHKSISRQESTRLVEDETYPATFLENLSKAFSEDPTFCSDVIFVVEDEEIPAHRIVLSCFSDYFRGLFKMQKSNKIPIPGVGKDVFKQILTFAYTGKIHLSTDNVQDLLVAADYFRSQGLVEKASLFIEDFMENTNVLDIWELAERLSITDLCRSCKKFAASNFETIIGGSETKNRLLASPPSIFEEILKSGHLLIRDPNTMLPSYADEREKSVIGLIRDYCGFESGRAEITLLLLQNCVNWMHLAAVTDEGSLREGFDQGAAEYITKILLAVKKGVEVFRSGLVSSTGHKELKCDQGHPYLIFIHDRFCDVAMLPSSPEEKTEMENLLNLSFVGCDCDHISEALKKTKQKTSNLRVLTDEALASERIYSGALSIETLLRDVMLRGFEMRGYSCSKDLISSRLADGNQTGRPTDDFLQIATRNEHITSFKVTTRLWDGREVLRSIGVGFSSGRTEEHGGPGVVENTYEFSLQPGEHVIDLEASAGWKIDSIAFVIGKLEGTEMRTRKVGPFGGDGGSARTTKPMNLNLNADVPLDHFLVGFKGKLTLTQGQKSVTHLGPIWRNMSCFHYEWILSDGTFHCSTRLDDEKYGYGYRQSSSSDDDDGVDYDFYDDHEVYDGDYDPHYDDPIL